MSDQDDKPKDFTDSTMQRGRLSQEQIVDRNQTDESTQTGLLVDRDVQQADLGLRAEKGGGVSRWRRFAFIVGLWGVLNVVLWFSVDAYELVKIYRKNDLSLSRVWLYDTLALSNAPYTRADFDTVRYRLMRPKSVVAGEKYPVLMYLHGAGERGDDMLASLKRLPMWMASSDWREKYPCYVVVPQCPNDCWWSDRQQPESGPDYMDNLYAMVQAVLKDEPGADPERVYVAGFSMGGFGTWEFGARYPEVVAAIAPASGGGRIETAERLISVPIWAFHGDDDKVVPVAGTRDMIQAIEAAGGTPKYTELHGVGHSSMTPMFKQHDVLPWLFEQRRRK